MLQSEGTFMILHLPNTAILSLVCYEFLGYSPQKCSICCRSWQFVYDQSKTDVQLAAANLHLMPGGVI